jgi:hypothetical protein
MKTPDLLEIERLLPAHETDRSRAVRILSAKLGHSAFIEFLKTPQPDFQDRTGADLLATSATDIIRRLAEPEPRNEIDELIQELRREAEPFQNHP